MVIAIQVQVDANSHIIEDKIGLKLIVAPDDWQERPEVRWQGEKIYLSAAKKITNFDVELLSFTQHFVLIISY